MSTNLALNGPRERAFALVDAENQTIWNGRRLSAVNATAVFEEIDTFVVGVPTCAALTGSLLAPYVPLLAVRGWALDLVRAGPDAADLALMERARFAIVRGCTDLIVVSGDHIFTQLAEDVRLHVVSHRERLSLRLAAMATSVSYLAKGPEAPMAA